MGNEVVRSLRLAAVVLCAVVFLGFEVQIMRTAFGPGSPISTALRGIEASWESGRLTVVKPPPPKVQQLGLKKGDAIVAVEDAQGNIRHATSPLKWRSCVKHLAFGKPFALHVERPAAANTQESLRIPIPAQEPPPRSLLGTLGGQLPQLLFTLICIGTATLIGFARPGNPAAFNASLLFFCVSSLSFGAAVNYFPPVLREIGFVVWIFPFSVVTALFMRFFLVFPAPSPIDRRLPWLKRAGLIFGLTFGCWNYAWHYLQTSSPVAFNEFFMPIQWVDWILDILYAACFVVGFASLVLNTLHAEGADERRRGRLLLCGSVGILPWLSLFLWTVIVGPPGFPDWVYYLDMLFLALFPATFAYTVLRHRVFGVRVILRRGLRFAFLSKGFLVAEAVAVFLVFYYGLMPMASGLLRDTPPTALAALTAALTAVVVLGVRALNRGVIPHLERRFFREAYDARAILTDLARSVRKLSASPEALFSTVTSTLIRSLHPDRTAIYLKGSEILRMPVGDSAHRNLARGEAKDAPGDYFCVWSADSVRVDPAFPDPGEIGMRLSGATAVARRLAECASWEEPEALEMYPDKPRSWASTVLEYGSLEDVRFVGDTGFRLLVPLTSGDRVLGFLALGDKLSEEPYGREDRELLLTIAQQMADNLEYADLVREGQEQAILRREVEIAREVQEKLLVQKPTPFPRLDYSGACRPARFVGGDYYDYIRCGESHLGFALGDVSGKGVSAALLMAGLQAALRVRADIHGDALERVFEEINRHMCDATDEGRFATLFYGIFDPKSLRFDFVNAGHNPPMLFRGGTGELERLKATGTILGLSPDSRFSRSSVELRAGDTLLLFSDGITEALDETEEFYGEERLEAVVRPLLDRPAESIRDAVFHDVDGFAGERHQNDDITLVVIRVTLQEGKSSEVSPPSPIAFPSKASSADR